MTLAMWRQRINNCLNRTGPGVVFQPIFSLEPQVLVGYEALARFPGDEGPLPWFNAASETGMAIELETAAVVAALECLGQVPDPIYLAVNVSPATVIHPVFAAAVASYPLDQVVLELTEHEPVKDYAELRGAIDDLRDAGAIICTPVGPSSAPRVAPRIAVDDLGSGFASMRHVLELRPDFMKLDVALIQGIDHSLSQRALVASLVTFGAKLGVRVVAEGVETESECVTVRALDVHSAQGYLLGRPGPLPAPDLAA